MATYGDPCRGCGYDWSLEPEAGRRIVNDTPARLGVLLADRTGKEGCADLQWNAATYVVHLADVLRIWADRVAAAALGNSDPIVPYDEGELGVVRGYRCLPLDAGLREVRRALLPGGRLVAMERRAQPGARGHASHGWTEDQAAAFADRCREHGFTDVHLERATIGRRSTVTVVTRAP